MLALDRPTSLPMVPSVSPKAAPDTQDLANLRRDSGAPTVGATPRTDGISVHSSRQRPSLATVLAAVPRGGALPDQAWRARHRGILVLLGAHVVALAELGIVLDETLTVRLLAPGVVAAFTLAAMWARLSRSAQALMATLGLLSSSALLIVLFDGLIEAHFHFFFTVAVVSLYQQWSPYFLAVGFVLVHHLVLGTLLPDHVYNHAAAVHNPWLFALVHGGAVLAESVACLVFWRVSEDALNAERANQEALEHTNMELTNANAEIADLVAMLSHDLRSPLTVLVGYSEMALESWPDLTQAAQLDFVRRVNRAGQSLNSMLEDTLSLSVLDGDGAAPRPMPVRVDEVVREALSVLPEPRPVVDLDGLEAHTVIVDRGHLWQVLTNLITNAIKYGEGRIAISTVAHAEFVFLRVVDFGPGVPAAFVPHLFDRFSRSEEAREGRQRGTGLGLYITRSLLLANEGDVAYEPTLGGGATFCLRLPQTPPTPR